MGCDLISIIIPVYNAESYITQCMEGVLNQTYHNLEIIVVDDGSEDGSAELCKDYVQKDTRIRYFHKRNGGPASARNVGIRQASGKYLYFMDVDDTLEKNAVERLYDACKREKADFVIGNAVHINIYGKRCIEGKTENESFEGREAVTEWVHAFADDIKSHKILWTVWGKLYRADIIKANHLCFNEKVDAWEDTLFVITYMAYCNSIYYVGECLYTCNHYNQTGSASGKMWKGPLDFRYIVRKTKKVLKGEEYNQVIANCYSEYAIMSMFTSIRLLKADSVYNIRKLYCNVYRIVQDRKLQDSIVFYVQKHGDNAKIIPTLIKKKWVWFIIIVFKLQVKRLEKENRVGLLRS